MNIQEEGLENFCCICGNTIPFDFPTYYCKECNSILELYEKNVCTACGEATEDPNSCCDKCRVIKRSTSGN